MYIYIHLNMYLYNIYLYLPTYSAAVLRTRWSLLGATRNIKRPRCRRYAFTAVEETKDVTACLCDDDDCAP